MIRLLPTTAQQPTTGGAFGIMCLVLWLASSLWCAGDLTADSGVSSQGIPSFSLQGGITLREDDKVKDDREVRFAVVYYEPSMPPPAPQPQAPQIQAPQPQAPQSQDTDSLDDPYAVTMVRKAFMPRVQAVPVGSTVSFPNNDEILHNVFSLSGRNRFDLGLYRKGEVEATVFDHPGIVQIFCNVHHSMIAYVLVLDTPFYAHPEADGSFRLDGLPPGPGRLTVWHERSNARTFDIVLTQDSDLELTIDITKPRVPPHRNKFGKPYKRSRRGRAY